MHYAVPIIFHQNLILNGLYTDLYAKRFVRTILGRFPWINQRGLAKKLSGRHVKGLPDNKVIQYPVLGMRYLRKQNSSNSPAALVATYNWAGKRLSESVLKSGLGDTDALYLYNGAAAELMEATKDSGAKLILEQAIAPFSTERQLLFREYQLFPEWNTSRKNQYEMNPAFEELIGREKKEWALADKIICGSQYVISELNRNGQYSAKAAVVPYGVDTSYFKPKLSVRPSRPDKLKIIVIGVGLRKGTQYLLKIADRINERSRITLIGPLNNTPEDIKQELKSKLNWVGAVPRIDILEYLQAADLLVIASVCEGSATVSYEALAMGIPVIATANSGAMVVHKWNGYVVDPFDSEQIIEAINYFYEPEVLGNCSNNARNSREDYGLRAYESRLMHQIENIHN